jgi:CheY-like chemotaxis protein
MAAKILIVDDEPDFQDLISQKFTARIRADQMQFIMRLRIHFTSIPPEAAEFLQSFLLKG